MAYKLENILIYHVVYFSTVDYLDFVMLEPWQM